MTLSCNIISITITMKELLLIQVCAGEEPAALDGVCR